MAETEGFLSKGCFTFLPDKKQKQKYDASKYFCDIQGGDNGSWLIYQNEWQQLEEKVEALGSEVTTQLLNATVEFLKSSLANGISTHIPTACVMLGVNVPDHDSTLSRLTSLISSHVTHHVARLTGSDVSSVERTLGSLLHQLENDNEESDENPPKVKKRTFGTSFRRLLNWYESAIRTSPKKAARKRRSQSQVRLMRPEQSVTKPLVIIIDQLETCTAQPLRDVIKLFSERLAQLPVCLVLGVATGTSAVHSLITRHILDRLELQCFAAPSAGEQLNQTIKYLLLDSSSGFRLGGKLLDKLVGLFLHHDFCSSHFIRAMQVCMMRHFLQQPLSTLCCSEDDLPSQVKSLSPALCTTLRRLPSFRGWIEAMPKTKQKHVLTDDKALKTAVLDQMYQLHRYHQLFALGVSTLFAVSCTSCGSSPFGNYERNVYCLCLTDDVCSSDEFQTFAQLIQCMDIEELQRIIRQLQTVFVDVDGCTDLNEQLQSASNHLRKFDESSSDANKPTRLQLTPGSVKQHELKEHIQRLSGSLAPTSVQKSREVVINAIKSFCRTLLAPPGTQPLHEVLYATGWKSLKQLLIPDVRGSLLQSLRRPPDFVAPGRKRAAPPPDVCVLYRLYTECGKLINLYDWLQAFVEVVQGKSDGEEVSEALQQRFFRAISELQIMGLIKPTKRKTDHVSRLCWD